MKAVPWSATATFLATLAGLACSDATNPEGLRGGIDGAMLVSTTSFGQTTIATINPDGSGYVPIIENTAGLGRLAWAPDRRRFAYVRNGRELRVADRDGTSDTVLFKLSYSGVGNVSWSPGGDRILFDYCDPASGRVCGIHSIGSDGSGIDTILRSAALPHSSAWSSDGLDIAFMQFVGDSLALYVLRPSASSLRRLAVARTGAVMGSPAWRPDGSEIAFVSAAAGTWDIWVVRSGRTPGPSGLRRLTIVTSGFDIAPAWSPDGRWVAFIRNARLMKVAGIGGEPRQISTLQNVNTVAWQ